MIWSYLGHEFANGKKAHLDQCDQIEQFIGLWLTF